jgi:ubiquinone biosynthesis protein UbiJ
MAQNRERAFSYVQIEGDAEFANVISQVAQGVRWEAEEDLSRFIGDIAARRIVGGARMAIDAAFTAQRRLSENIAEYFLEEQPLLVRPRAVQDFSSDVAALRDDVERLSKRIDRLKRGLE